MLFRRTASRTTRRSIFAFPSLTLRPAIIPSWSRPRIPPGTSGGARLRLRGRGIHDPRAGATGDMYALVRILAPKSLSPRAVELLKQFDDEAGFDPRADSQWRL